MNPIVSTVRWTRVDDKLPHYGVMVAVWIEALTVVARAYLAADCTSTPASPVWRLESQSRVEVGHGLVTAWAPLPNGPLPPPDTIAA